MTQIPNASFSLPFTIIANLKAKPGKKPEVFDAVYALLATPAPRRAAATTTCTARPKIRPLWGVFLGTQVRG